MADFISMDGDFLETTAAMLKELEDLDKAVREEIMEKALDESAEILIAEQKRILRNHPNVKIQAFADYIKKWAKYKGRNKMTMAVGYDTPTLRKDLKFVYVEFGRRGGRRDKKGRKIGEVRPYSHIRAAWWNKKEEVNNRIAEVVNEEIEKRWNGGR